MQNLNELGNTNIRNRITENLDIIYNEAMSKVIKEVADSVEKGEDWTFFDFEIPKRLRFELLQALRAINSNRTIPSYVLDDVKNYLTIPESSPWILADFVTVRLPEEFSRNERARNISITSKQIKGRYKRSAKGLSEDFDRVARDDLIGVEGYFRYSFKEKVLDKLPKRN